MESSVIQSGAPSREWIYQFAQVVIHGSIDPKASVDKLMDLVREEVVCICAVSLAILFPPHIREYIYIWRVHHTAIVMGVQVVGAVEVVGVVIRPDRQVIDVGLRGD